MNNHDFAPATGNGEADPESIAAQGAVKITAKYAITVSNELFHNGNVEAWVNIVESYKAKYPGLDVHIFFGGKAVENIQGLFKWGMIKNSDAILFSVSGADIQGVAKLKRYLYEGASRGYLAYVKKDVNKVLPLF